MQLLFVKLNRTADSSANSSWLESSFYTGHTVYGGAATVSQLMNNSVPYTVSTSD